MKACKVWCFDYKRTFFLFRTFTANCRRNLSWNFFQKEHFSLKYDSSFLKEGQTEIETCFFEKLRTSEKSDFMVGYTTVGPHRDDISFYINEISARSFGSQGQQRSCSACIKIGRI